MSDSGQSSEHKNADRNAEVKAKLIKFQVGRRTPLATVLEITHVMKLFSLVMS